MKILNASATQTDGDNGKSNWIVNSSEGEKLYVLDMKLNEKQVMEAIHMSRDFSKEAFKDGMLVAENKYNIEIQGVMARGQSQIDMLNERIAGLSAELLRLMGEDEE